MIGFYFSASFPGNIIVQLMQFLNICVYGLVSSVFKTFMVLTDVQLFEEGTIAEFQDRIYVILGIFMLFRLAFSLLTSIVNPDHLLDKEKGMGKIITRTVIALVMLIFVPTVFKYALEWQSDIVKAVPKVIIGHGTETSTFGESDAGEQLSATALKAFFEVNQEYCDVEENVALEELNGPQKVGETVNLASKLCDGKPKVYLFKFNGFVSILAGIFIMIYLLSYCIDVAIRVIKIGILRLLAPIPIISYIDPKSEKSGAFGNWLKECISTYVELFIKVGILYFIIYILGEISSDASLFNIPSTGLVSAFLIRLFLILGSFFFMGKAANFICSILGIKYDKGSGGVLGKALGIAGGALAGMGLGALGAAVTKGGLSGIASAALTGATSGGKPLAAFGKGRDIATQFKSGGKDTKYKSLSQKAQEKLMTNRAARDIFGVSSPIDAQKIIDNAKKDMLNDDARFQKAESLLNSGKAFDFDDVHYETEEDFARFRAKLYDGKDSLLSIKNQSASKYSDLKEAAQYAGFKDLNKSSMQKASEALGYFREERPRYLASRNTSPQNSRNTASNPSTPPAQSIPVDYTTESGILLNPSSESWEAAREKARREGKIK